MTPKSFLFSPLPSGTGDQGRWAQKSFFCAYAGAQTICASARKPETPTELDAIALASGIVAGRLCPYPI